MKTAVVVATASLLLGGGLWLAGQSTPGRNAIFASAASSGTTGTDAPTDAQEAAVPEGYERTPYLSDTQEQSFEAPEEVLEPDTDYAAVIDTNRGRMVVDLYEEETPQTVNNFVFLARHRYYDGVVFHRVLEDFMAQTGDPTGTGRGGPGYVFEDEIVEGLSHDEPGTLSMANAGPGTNGSQFFITFAPTPWLDGAHTVFGEVVEGLEVLDALERIDPGQPSAFTTLGDTLENLSAQGIELSGSPETTLEAYISEALGAVPGIGESFSLDGYGAAVGQNNQTNETVVGFWPSPDVIERLFIIQRPR